MIKFEILDAANFPGHLTVRRQLLRVVGNNERKTLNERPAR